MTGAKRSASRDSFAELRPALSSVASSLRQLSSTQRTPDPSLSPALSELAQAIWTQPNPSKHRSSQHRKTSKPKAPAAPTPSPPSCAQQRLQSSRSDTASRGGRSKHSHRSATKLPMDAQTCWEPSMAPDLVEKILAQKMEEQFTEMRRAFRSFDLDHSGSIGKAEFKRLLTRYSLYPDDAGLDYLFGKMDPDGSGELGYDEFIEYFAQKLGHNPAESGGVGKAIMDANSKYAVPVGPTRKVRGMTAEEAEKLLMQKVEEQFGNIGRAFRSYDDDHSGSIGKAEFRRLLTRYCIYMDDKEFDRFFKRVDPDGGGEVEYDEFISYFGKHLQPAEEGGVGALLQKKQEENKAKRNPYLNHRKKTCWTPDPDPPPKGAKSTMLNKLSSSIAASKKKTHGVTQAGLIQRSICSDNTEHKRPSTARRSGLIKLSSTAAKSPKRPVTARSRSSTSRGSWTGRY